MRAPSGENLTGQNDITGIGCREQMDKTQKKPEGMEGQALLADGETAPQDHTLTDQEVEEASGGKRPPASVYHDKPFF